MSKAVTLGQIERDIEKLTPQEQLKLVEKLAQNLAKGGRGIRKKLDWKGLYGLGKGLWREDAQEYVNRLREDRR